MQLVDQLKNISSYYLSGEKVYYIQQDGLFVYSVLQDKKRLAGGEDIDVEVDDSGIYVNIDKKLFEVKEDDRLQEIFAYNATSIYKRGEYILCLEEIDEEEEVRRHIIFKDGHEILNIVNDKLLSTVGNIFFWLEIATMEKEFVVFDIHTGKDLWKFDARETGRYYDEKEERWEEGYITGDFAVKNNMLILFASCNEEENAKGRQYIALNGDNGEIVWQRRSALYGGGNVQFYGNDIVYMRGRKIQLLDAGTGEPKDLIDLSGQLPDDVSVYNAFKVVKNKLYFCEPRKKQIGIINLDTFEVEQLFLVETKAFQINMPEVNDRYLFVQDSDKTVHIYAFE
ncbi:PQQ-binding-like beta-propeller repeat protein [Chitinophaga qingshengii]|uniref:PQQ-binding-like beta-propeller repeat protein n=1 Tax=Chitinophaga qingshengii TaxID=1569794 RepID=A0ABR7TQM1_9BACT|nr:PQQ-binding-like beta-propeller repeat protein [Chitinophaga qingshengii]MBC9932780.1 PQQ-binding-like beta-propeller repeat protein [Chitinophaga qingshengii]